MEIFEEDQQLVDALEAADTDSFATMGNAYYDAREQQREWQRNLIQQQGGQINPEEPGRFEFDLRPMSHDMNRWYGIDERRYQVNLRQEGNIIDNIAPALREGLHRAINQLLDHGNIPNTHRVYFDMFSERIRDGASRANGLVAGDWRNNSATVDRIFNHFQSALSSNESFQMDVWYVVPAESEKQRSITWESTTSYLKTNPSSKSTTRRITYVQPTPS